MGGVSIIAAELELLTQAVGVGPYQYYHLVSGQDFPLLPQDAIHRFFDSHSGYEFLSPGCDTEWGRRVGLKRSRYYYYFQDARASARNVVEERVFRLAQKSLLMVQKVARVDRVKSLRPYLMAGANWFSITHRFAQYLVEERDYITKQFDRTFCCDEVFIHTMLRKHGGFSLFPNGNLRFTKWKRQSPHPEIITPHHRQELMDCDALFARKFDIDAYPESLDMVRDVQMLKRMPLYVDA